MIITGSKGVGYNMGSSSLRACHIITRYAITVAERILIKPQLVAKNMRVLFIAPDKPTIVYFVACLCVLE